MHILNRISVNLTLSFIFFLSLCFSSDTQTLVNDSSGPLPVIVKAAAAAQQIEMHTQPPPPSPPTTTTANPFQSKQERGKAMRQVIAAFIANLGTINTGLVFGFSAVVIPQLKQNDSIIQIDESQASWIGEFFSTTFCQ